MSRSRRLAAIMFTDIQGYTALMQQNEEKAVKAREKHRRVFNSVTERYKGRVLQYYGDGTLSIFDSAIDAVKCGIDMQVGFREEPAIPVRIGIHTGDIIFSEEDIIGDSVNVASRIESLAVPGSVFISGKVYDEIRNQESIQAIRIKAFKLKNVEQPIDVYAITNEGLAVPAPEDITGKTDEAKQHTAKPWEVGPAFLATKLYIPSPRAKSVRRPRLIERLNEGLRGKLTLISAPAGFGKTTLAAEWATKCGRPLAWLSLDERDRDPGHFLMYFIAALQTIDEHLGAGVLNMLHAPQQPPVESILTILLNEIAARPAPFVLVLDDYHVVDAKPVDGILTFMLDHLPPQMHLAITTREDPDLPLARLRVRDQLTELRVADLRFTFAEAAGFLQEVMGLDLAAADIAALEDRTEGWIAGLQMVALSMQGRADTAGFIQAFTGSHRFILDYLAEEVLQRQPEGVRRFLLYTAILDQLCDSLCDAVTGLENGRDMLETLERDNLFVIPLDDERRWYRYHHLFADVLRARLGVEQPGQIPVLHRRAGEWFANHNSPGDAIRHALAAKDFVWAAELIELAWPAMDEHFQTTAWLDWAKALPEEIVSNRPVLIAGYAWAHLNAGALEAGEARLREVEKWLEITKAAQGQPEAPPPGMIVVDEAQFRDLPGSAAVARIYLAQALGDVPGTVNYARQALEQLPEKDHIRRGQAAALLGLAYWANGELEAAHQALTGTMTHFQLAGNIPYAISVTYGLADIRIAQGRLRDAVKTYEHSLRLVTDQGEPLPPGTADLYLGLGDLYLEQGDPETAAQQLLKSESLGREMALPDWECRLCIIKARFKEYRGDLDGALDLLEEAERLYYRTPMPEVRPIAAQKTRLWIKQGRLAEARAWANEHSLSADDALNYLSEFDHITLACVLIAEFSQYRKAQSIDDASSLLERLLMEAEKGERKGRIIEILTQQALAHAAQGHISLALPPLERALAMAEPEGYVRLFTEKGQPMAQLLSEAAAHGMMTHYIGKLLSAFNEPLQQENKVYRPAATPAQPLVEPLTGRELEILRLIAQGLSNQEISRRLFLALSTVKGHNRNIFGKLEAQRRTEAVARARQLGLI